MANRLPQVDQGDTLRDTARMTLAALAVVRSVPALNQPDRGTPQSWEEIAHNLTVNYTNHEWPGVTVNADAVAVLIELLIARGVLD